ncbi:unnamed protein product [Rotaria socialis]|uniref:XLF-like N-terminal domain-containing protein n=1 Tax=Rotaria socialis TaxID=392032 RepID=A0A818Q6I7_9BILA|nr:unnamed protein product [Rotaria socialis]CAF3455913.1 unnamed protein product [Rotaria socialis]CAF3633290.1 unnamed protein product [Rotaria socialis]
MKKTRNIGGFQWILCQKDMSFEDFASTYTRSFGQTPIRIIRMSSPLTAYSGSNDQPYRHLVLLCQPHFTSKSISIAFYLNGTAYFEYLTEDKIRQRLQLLNNSRRTPFHCDNLESILSRFKTMLSTDAMKQDNNELHAKLLSERLLSVEIYQDDLKFKFRCDERPQLFEQHYVRQLLIQVNELSQRQAYLCELLEHKDQLPQFDAKLFLNTPTTLDDDEEDSDEDDEILSSSTTGRLWKTAFGRRDGSQFLDICLLKKAYIKTLEEMSDDDHDEAEEEEKKDLDTISSIVDTLVDQTVVRIDQQNDDDEIVLAERIGKRSLTTSTVNFESGTQKIKRLRSTTASANVSI